MSCVLIGLNVTILLFSITSHHCAALGQIVVIVLLWKHFSVVINWLLLEPWCTTESGGSISRRQPGSGSQGTQWNCDVRIKRQLSEEIIMISANMEVMWSWLTHWGDVLRGQGSWPHPSFSDALHLDLPGCKKPNYLLIPSRFLEKPEHCTGILKLSPQVSKDWRDKIAKWLQDESGVSRKLCWRWW